MVSGPPQPRNRMVMRCPCSAVLSGSSLLGAYARIFAMITDAVELTRALPHQRAPRPLHFPSEAEVSETLLHLLMRTMLFQILKEFVGLRGAVGSEQFIYYNASNPQQDLS
jgi:hypothetical protein